MRERKRRTLKVFVGPFERLAIIAAVVAKKLDSVDFFEQEAVKKRKQN